jgi:CRISPR system Cascade subunit CasE
MHLTRLQLDLRNAQVRRDLADPYDMHRTLVRAFVQDETQTPPRFLWRVEPENILHTPVVLVQSVQAAQWSVLEAVRSYLKQSVQTKQIQLDALIQTQSRYRFRLFANPTVTREGKRYGLVSEDAQLNWLKRQGERLGFEVEAALVTGSEVLKSHGKSIHVQRACFEGILVATDSQVLATAVRDGVGPAKAFGCGLLSLGHLKAGS